MIGSAVLAIAIGVSGFQVLEQSGDIERVSPPVLSASGGAASIVQDGEQFALADGARLVLGGDEAWFEASGSGRLMQTAERQFQWQGRRLRTIVGKTPVKLQTASGTLRLAAGEMRVSASGVTTTVAAIAGKPVRVFYGGELYNVAAGSGLVVGPGVLMREKLPASPTPIFPAPHAAMQVFRFEWAGLPDASGYVWELARDPGFQEILMRAEIERPAFNRANQTLPVGLVFWRVSARAPSGLEGLPSEAVPLRVRP